MKERESPCEKKKKKISKKMAIPRLIRNITLNVFNA